MPPDDAVGQSGAHEDLFQRSRLRVRAVEDCDVAVVDARTVQRLDLVGDELRLVVLRVAGEADDLLAVAAVAPQLLVLAVEVVADDGVGRREDVLGRAVVLLEEDDLRAREVALELADVADVGAAEGVDRLVGVTDDGQRGTVDP